MHSRLPIVLLAVACSPPPPPPPPPKDPPRVFLVAAESNVVGTQIALTMNVNGCEKVQSAALLDRDTLIKEVSFGGNPTALTIASNELGNLYPTRGLAADLSLVAKATCDDGRSNTSQPVPVKFLPVERVVDPGGQAAPDAFFAEGGFQGVGTSLVGCIGTQAGTALARVNTEGQVIGANTSLPFPCSIGSGFTDKNLATGKRWLVEREQGAFAFDPALNITSFIRGRISAIGVGPDGDAVVFDRGEMLGPLKRVSHTGNQVKWARVPNGLVMGDPVVQPQTNLVIVPVWVDDAGQYRGQVTVERWNYDNGNFVGRDVLSTVEYGFLNQAAIPPAVLNADGSILYFPFQAGSTVNTAQSRVIACATNAPCDVPRWTSPLLEGLVVVTLPFASGTQVAAIASNRVWFLDATTGQVTNRDGKPYLPDGSLSVLGVQPGLGQDFYVLNGPAATGYPIEIIAIASPSAGEAFRYQMNGGTAPTSSLTVAIDDAGTAWLRVGLKLVKPLPLGEYKRVRGD